MNREEDAWFATAALVSGMVALAGVIIAIHFVIKFW
jgi:hypothetical protein